MWSQHIRNKQHDTLKPTIYTLHAYHMQQWVPTWRGYSHHKKYIHTMRRVYANPSTEMTFQFESALTMRTKVQQYQMSKLCLFHEHLGITHTHTRVQKKAWRNPTSHTRHTTKEPTYLYKFKQCIVALNSWNFEVFSCPWIPILSAADMVLATAHIHIYIYIYIRQDVVDSCNHWGQNWSAPLQSNFHIVFTCLANVQEAFTRALSRALAGAHYLHSVCPAIS